MKHELNLICNGLAIDQIHITTHRWEMVRFSVLIKKQTKKRNVAQLKQLIIFYVLSYVSRIHFSSHYQKTPAY